MKITKAKWDIFIRVLGYLMLANISLSVLSLFIVLIIEVFS